MMLGFPGDPDSKESACDAGDLGSIPGHGPLCSPGWGQRLEVGWAWVLGTES